jgi:protein-S-isoprenylcysteine O-methyltransferase Ste14
MKPYFVGHPVPTVLFVCTIAVWIALEVRQALQRRPEASSSDRGSLLLLRIWTTVAIVMAALAVARVPGAAVPAGVVAFGIGLALMWCGMGLRFWSFRTLGRYFTFTVMTSADQPVVTTGPYRFVRHPGYAGIILVLTGIGATYENWLSLAALALVPLIGFIYRIQVEEAALAATLGRAYTSYAAGRKRLIPGVW